MGTDRISYINSIMSLIPPGYSPGTPDPPVAQPWWGLEYWRKSAICRPMGLTVPYGNRPHELAVLEDDFLELILSGCADRIVLELTSLGPFPSALAKSVFRLVYRATSFGSLIALVAGDEPTAESLHQIDFGPFAPILPTVAEATALLQERPPPDRIPAPLG